MRLLLNGLPMLGQVTGVGQYGLRLLEALERIGGEQNFGEIDVFHGRGVVSARDFLQAEGGTAAASPRWNWKRLVGRLVPGARRAAQILLERRLLRRLERRRYSLFHETNYVAPPTLLPLVTTVHDMGFLRFPQFMPRDRVRWLRRCLGKSLAASRVILADSAFTKQELLELYPRVRPENVVVARLGVDLAWYAHPEHARRIDEIRRAYRLPRCFLLFLGTLEPRKNLQGLLCGFRRLPRELQDEYPLVLAGMKGWRREYFHRDLEALCRRGAVRQLGYVPRADVPVLMKAASLFCFPSHYEGFGLPPLEAAACGTPVLCSRAASLPEVLGDAAYYVDPGDDECIAHGLAQVLRDDSLRNRLHQQGPSRAAQFTWDRCAIATLEAYRLAA
jgi:alpha-1,3-rhamnosyl/mannosyltransferase